MQFDYVRWLRDHYRTLVMYGGVGLLVGIGCYFGLPRQYAATASLMVMQAEVRPVRVATESDHANREERDDYVATQSGILASPLIMQRALDTVGLRNCPSVATKAEPVDAALKRLRVSRPDRTAKILTLEYRVQSRREAVQTLAAVVNSYTDYVAKDLYRASQNRIVTLIESKQGDVRTELERLTAEHVAFLRAHPGLTVARQGHNANSERVLRWCNAANDTELRQVRVNAQLNMARELAAKGIKVWTIAYAMGQLGDSGDLLRSIDVRAMQYGGNDYLRSLMAEQQKVADEQGPSSSRALALQEKIQAIHDRAAPADDSESRDVIASMDSTCARLTRMKDECNARYTADLKRFSDDEIAMLEEDALTSRLAQARTVFNALMDNLKQAQLNSEYNAVNASVLEAPHATVRAVSPQIHLCVGLGLVFGVLGGVVAVERAKIAASLGNLI